MGGFYPLPEMPAVRQLREFLHGSVELRDDPISPRDHLSPVPKGDTSPGPRLPAPSTLGEDLAEHLFTVEEFAALGGFQPLPYFPPHLIERGLVFLFALLEEAKPFAEDLAC